MVSSGIRVAQSKMKRVIPKASKGTTPDRRYLKECMATSRSGMPCNNIAIAVVSFAITCAALPISCFHGDVARGAFKPP